MKVERVARHTDTKKLKEEQITSLKTGKTCEAVLEQGRNNKNKSYNMKVRLLIMFFVITFLLPLLVFVIIGLLGAQYPFLKLPLLRYGIGIALALCSIVGFTLHILKRKNIRWYLFFVVVSISLLIEMITSPLRGYVNFMACSVVTFAVYFIFINLMLMKHASKLKPQWILFACIIGCSILQLPIRILSFSSSLISLPDFLFHLFGIFMGYFFYISGKYIKSGIVVTSLLCCTFLYFKGYNLWLHKLNFGTFSGIVHNKAEIPKFQFTDREGNTLTNQDFNGKFTILDFWNTGCGVCFREFPKFEEQYVKYSSNNNVVLYAVNVKLPRDKEGVAFEIFSERGYSFPTLQSGLSEDAKSIFGVTVYPTVVVLNPAGVMVFRGNKENAFSFVENELKKN